ncbi:MAG TPA: DUF2085 domain-containing protein [Anaerolineae bacterium]|nr:DUF2085 domain-containing protein [Anaerolineae bacterium]
MSAQDPVGSAPTAVEPRGSDPRSAPEPGGLSARRWLNRLLLALAVVVILASMLLVPHGGLPDRLDYVSRAVCGRLPEHSFFCGERQLPLCARCTGTYLGVLAAYVVLGIMGRGRANKLPALPLLLTLFLFIALWALDGVNSYVTLFTGSPLLYEPSNLLRLLSGLLQGTALMVIVRPIFAFTLWAESREDPVIRGHGELALVVLVAALLGLAAQTELAWLYYPLALSSVAGELLILSLVNTLVVAILLRREAMAQSWRQAAPLWIVGLAAALVEVSLINLGRVALGRWIGLPL